MSLSGVERNAEVSKVEKYMRASTVVNIVIMMFFEILLLRKILGSQAGLESTTFCSPVRH